MTAFYGKLPKVKDEWARYLVDTFSVLEDTLGDLSIYSADNDDIGNEEIHEIKEKLKALKKKML